MTCEKNFTTEPSGTKSFALIGSAGYVAPKHMQAIKEAGGDLAYTYDHSDSMGKLDSYFPNCKHFIDEDWFWKQIRMGGSLARRISTVSICSPNYTHSDYIRTALKAGCDAMCEKPLVINPWELDTLASLERTYEKKVYTVLQLRYHPDLVKLKSTLLPQKKKVKLVYVTSRGEWYNTSWKSNRQYSGGVAMNIGIHFFDMLLWLFGKCAHYKITNGDYMKWQQGTLELEHADVEWFLSIDEKHISKFTDRDVRVYRSITIDEEEIEFSNVFTELHTEVYKAHMDNRGYGIEDARPAVELAYQISNNY